MVFLKLRHGAQCYADGSPRCVPLVVERARKFGPDVSVECISRRRCQLVTGAHDAGKSRWLRRLAEAGAAIWRAPVLALAAREPLQQWCESAPAVATWWDARPLAERRAPWAQLRQWERVEALPEYLAQSGAVLVFDDIHLLSGRKLAVAVRCVTAARLWVVAASDEERCSPALRAAIARRAPQTHRLASDTAYDGTAALIWLAALVALACGAWEAAAVLGGLRLLANGRRAAKQG